MQQAWVLVPVNQSTPWISSYMNVKSEDNKGGKKFCICLNPTNLNKAILHEPFFTHTPNDVYAKLSKAKMLTVIDFKKASGKLNSLRNPHTSQHLIHPLGITESHAYHSDLQCLEMYSNTN